MFTTPPGFFTKRPVLPLWVLLRELQMSQEEISECTGGRLTRAAIAKWQTGAVPLHPFLACYLTELARIKLFDLRRWLALPRLELENLMEKTLDDQWFALAKIQLDNAQMLLDEQDKINQLHPEEYQTIKLAFQDSYEKHQDLIARTDPRKLLAAFRKAEGEKRKAALTKNQRKRERQSSRKGD